MNAHRCLVAASLVFVFGTAQAAEWIVVCSCWYSFVVPGHSRADLLQANVAETDVHGAHLATVSVLFVAAGVDALLSTSFSKNFPFGPFLPDEAIEVVASVTNISSDQTIMICEGVCIGDTFTYSLGGLASIPPGYSFYFGNLPAEAVFDGQIAGSLLPGEEKDFIFGVYTPTAPASPGFYAFLTQLQIFAATAERPMLTSATFSGNWEVVDCSPFPGGGATGGCFPGPGPFPGRVPEPTSISLLALALASLAFARSRKLH